MSATSILVIFIVLRLVQHSAERFLAKLNRAYYMERRRQEEAKKVLRIADEDMEKTLAYSGDKYWFSAVSGWIGLAVTLVFLGLGGLGLFEVWARSAAATIGGGEIVIGLIFFALLGVASMVMSLPFDWWRVFRLEEKHGFNRQNLQGFITDRLKGILLGAILGGLLLSAILWIMEVAGSYWWVYAWIAVSFFSLLTAYLYPTFLAPLFNKFSPVEGELRERIDRLAEKIGFKTAGIFVMDASKRSSHGNAYFTGVGSEKRIVLFDTLVDSMNPKEVTAVLAHELGHFKLKHVRWQLIRGILMTGVVFFLLGLCLPLEGFYRAFGLDGVSNYGALVVFGLWFGILDFALQPWENYLSRRNEFAADAFALKQIEEPDKLGDALLKLREKSHVMPLSHPLFSMVYHSHPPLLERLAAMGWKGGPGRRGQATGG